MQLGISASIDLTHPMLRHSMGFYFVNNGDTRAIQSYMGHANIKNTVIYSELSPNRYRGQAGIPATQATPLEW